MGPLAERVAGNDKAAGGGFSLIEVLVVVAILAIAAAATSLAFSNDDSGAATRESRRFAGAIEHAAARAQVRAETLGVSADGGGWQFWQRDARRGNWQPVTDDEVLAARRLPSAMQLEATSFASAPVAADIIIPLRPTGRNEPFVFTMAASTLRLAVAADPLNRVTVTPLSDTSAP